MTEIPEMFSVKIAYAVSTDLLVEGQTLTPCAVSLGRRCRLDRLVGRRSDNLHHVQFRKQLTRVQFAWTGFLISSSGQPNSALMRANYRSLTNAYKTKTEVFGSKPSTCIEVLETQTTCFMTFQNQCGVACKKNPGCRMQVDTRNYVY